MPPLHKIYTRTGDAGETALGGGQRIPKDALRIECYGTVDELNSLLGLAVAHGSSAALGERLVQIQQDLFDLGSVLCFLEQDLERWKIRGPGEEGIAVLEEDLDRMTEQVGKLANFILPGGSVCAAQLHVARTVCRRAERLVVHLAREEAVDPQVVRYLNRLSDWLFVAARLENREQGLAEPLWIRRK